MKPSLERAPPVDVARVVTFESGTRRVREDFVAGEEPLEIRIDDGRSTRSVATTMRTPGHDFELAAGFLFSEGLIAQADDVRTIAYCTDARNDAAQDYNIVTVELSRPARRDLAALERHFTMTSACGVCGRATIDALRERGIVPVTTSLEVTANVLAGLPDRLREHQRVFDSTGGLHAAALFDRHGTLQLAREDIGRHNALDKLAGSLSLERRFAAEEGILLVSGRASYELVQKTISLRAPVLCSVSAPSSLAVAMAQDFGVTLVGFLRGSRFNVYAGEHRITA
ncbi:MAG: formate dehydrogenase accessory sulfurtransferase FdhD [Candidatus Tyrphobacter sp.]